MDERALKAVLSDFALFSRHLLRRELRAYQLAPARAILDSVIHKRGRAFAVLFARQMGKNELSAALEAYILTLFQRHGGSLVKAAPTWKPQVVNSMLRLDGMLDRNPLTVGRWRTRHGYIREVGNARIYFFSADPNAEIVGATASILLEGDEAQDLDATKWDKDLSPMAATGNATRVLWGTSWDGATLLEATADALPPDQVFRFDWTYGAAANPDYGRYVEAERDRLGEEHPIFKTQYRLEAIAGAGRLFSEAHLAQLAGTHPRRARPGPGDIYLAALDVAGEEEDEPVQGGEFKPFAKRDSAVLTIARGVVATSIDAPGVQETQLQLVQHYAWTGRKHRELIPQLVDLLKNVWRVRHVVVDATGIGASTASFITGALGAARVTAFDFTATSKSHLAYELLAAVNGGRLKMYADDGTRESVEFWKQARLARYQVRAHQAMTFFVPETEGHDDFLMSLALLAECARVSPIRRATARGC